MTTYRVQGMDALRAAFLEFPKELATKALNQALAKGAAPIRDAAKQLAPKDTGRLAGSIVTIRDQKPQINGMDARYVVMVKWKGKDAAAYWRFNEFGTSKMPPRPFMRPAFESQKGAALQLIFQSLSDAVPKIAAQVRGA